jgi:hypothetical protein
VKLYRPVGDGEVVVFENTRAVFVADDLADLHDATSGVVVLPPHLDWSNSNSYDLGDPVRARTLYMTVLREASSEGDLATYLASDVLIREWSNLRATAVRATGVGDRVSPADGDGDPACRQVRSRAR